MGRLVYMHSHMWWRCDHTRAAADSGVVEALRTGRASLHGVHVSRAVGAQELHEHAVCAAACVLEADLSAGMYKYILRYHYCESQCRRKLKPRLVMGLQTAPFVFVKDLWSLNKADETAPNYSILDDLEGFRNSIDEMFHFKLLWPKQNSAAGMPQFQQEWKQSSNPVLTVQGGVSGYKPLGLSSSGYDFGGLEYNNHYSLLDGSSAPLFFTEISGHANGECRRACPIFF